MSSTNKTANLELSQFVGSDKPQWLVDYNGDMSKIDTGVGNVKAQADATDLTVSGQATAITNLQSASSDQASAIAQLQTGVTGNTGSINTINSLIGNGEPTTTDKTLIGAINELHADIEAIDPSGQGVTAGDVSYDNTNSGLTATDVQEAVDELKADIDAIVVPASTFEIVRGTLVTGQTSVTLTASKAVAATALIDVFANVYGLNPSAVTVSGSAVTLTFDAQTNDVAVAIRIDG